MAINRLASMRATEDRERVARALRPFLSDGNLFTRAAAVRALKVWATPDTMPALIDCLRDPEHSVRWAALDTLGSLKDGRAAEPIAELLHTGDRHFASRALQALGPAATAPALRRLRDPEWTVRMEACRILKATGGVEAVPALRAALHDRNGIVAMAAEEALRAILGR